MSSGRHDELFLALAQQHAGIDSLLDGFFDFLHRKTDFYVVTADPGARRMGFRPGHAEQKLLEAFRKYPMKHLDPSPPLTTASATNAAATTPATTATTTATVTAASTAKHCRSKTERPVPRTTSEGKQLPIGNGGAADHYTWTQTLDDVSIHVELPPATTSRDLECQIRPTHLRVALRPRNGDTQSRVLIDGELPERIRPDESLWSIESASGGLQISLDKIKKTWWASAIVGDPEIDTSQVDSTRQIHEYDDVTQGAIRKAMFDQQQRQQNLPTSDDMATERLLAEARKLPNSPI